MNKKRENKRFQSNINILSPLSPANAYPTRVVVRQRQRNGDNISPAFRTEVIDGTPLFTSDPPFISEPGFNGDDGSWLFANHGKSKYFTNPDVLAVGCSITSSIGVPRKYSWPQIVAAVSEKTVNTCSRPASGIAYEIFSAMQMMNYYGKPKVIYALFPDLFRAWVNNYVSAKEKDITIQEHLVWSSLLGSYIRPKEAIKIAMSDPGSIDRKNSVFVYQDFQGFTYNIPCELIVSKNFQAIRSLEVFAQLNNIEMKYCSWSSHANAAFSELGSSFFAKPINAYRHDLPMYWSLNEGGYEFCSPTEFICPDDTSCGHRPADHEQERLWLTAENQWHPGVHSHIHFAEHFIGRHIDNEELAMIGGLNDT